MMHLNPPSSLSQKETVGRLMIEQKSIPTVLEGTSLSEVKELLNRRVLDYATLNYIYVVDRQNRLRGVFSIKEFFEHQEEEKSVDEIMQKEIVSVGFHSHQERAALLALKHNIKAMPVLDKEGVFLGVLPSDILFKILDKEAVEDILRFGGIYHKGSFDDLLRLSTAQSVKHRLPWLLAGLLGGLAAASIISGFEATLSRNLVLAAFIPLVVYMADAVGTQMEVFIIRDLAINPTLNFLRYFLKHLSVVTLIGIIMSSILSLIIFHLYSNGLLSFVLGAALFFAILTSVFSGLIIPYLFGRLKLDPANASGPIATIIQDVLSVLVYFLVASRIL